MTFKTRTFQIEIKKNGEYSSKGKLLNAFLRTKNPYFSGKTHSGRVDWRLESSYRHYYWQTLLL